MINQYWGQSSKLYDTKCVHNVYTDAIPPQMLMLIIAMPSLATTGGSAKHQDFRLWLTTMPKLGHGDFWGDCLDIVVGHTN